MTVAPAGRKTPIRMEDAGKRYVKYDDQPMIITSLLRLRARTRRSRIWALRHIDLDAHEGECIGVIGRNGAGKTTMLQLLAGITAPTEGRVAVRGRVAPLIAVGVGFHPELTGRENVYVNGTILGLTRQQIDQRFDEILDFAEVEAFIDTPVKFYSSGMTVRLGFAVAIQSEPDVLLVDEVLAVGDLAFQWKCFDRMMQVRQQSGATIAVVSHNLHAVRKLCDRTFLIERGEIAFAGDTGEAIARFHAAMGEDREFGDDEAGSEDPAFVEAINTYGADGRPSAHVRAGDVIRVRADVRFDRAVEGGMWGFSLIDQRANTVYNEVVTGERIEADAGTRRTFEVEFPADLASGSYEARIGIRAADLTTPVARARHASFYVTGREMVKGVADLRGTFRSEAIPAPPEHGALGA